MRRGIHSEDGTLEKRAMDHYVERVVDLTEPEDNQIFNLTVEEARARVLTGKADTVRGDSWIVCAGCRRRQDGENGPVARSPHAVLPGKAAGGAGADCGAADRRHLQLAQEARDSKDSFIPATRAWFRRTTLWKFNWSDVPTLIQHIPDFSHPYPRRCPPI